MRGRRFGLRGGRIRIGSDTMTTDVVLVGGHKTNSRIYHTKQGCPYLPDTTYETTLAELEDRGFRECRYCDDTVRLNKHTDRSKSLRSLVNNNEIELDI